MTQVPGPFPGTADFQAQTTASLRYVQTATRQVGGGLTPTIVLTIADLTPNDQGLIVIMAAGFPVMLTAIANPLGFQLQSQTLLDSGQMRVVPFIGGVVTNGIATDITLQVEAPGQTLFNTTLVIFALQSSPTVIPTTRWDFIGHGDTTGALTVVAGATSVVLPTPPAGTYYRIKYLNATQTAVPAAIARCSWLRPSDGLVIASRMFLAAAGQSWDLTSLDLEWSTSLSFLNATSQSIAALVDYELWKR